MCEGLNILLTLKFTPSQHISESLDVQRGRKQPASQQERRVIGQTDLETDRVNVELDLG
jgi:hypothetical protein